MVGGLTDAVMGSEVVQHTPRSYCLLPRTRTTASRAEKRRMMMLSFAPRLLEVCSFLCPGVAPPNTAVRTGGGKGTIIDVLNF